MHAAASTATHVDTPATAIPRVCRADQLEIVRRVPLPGWDVTFLVSRQLMPPGWLLYRGLLLQLLLCRQAAAVPLAALRMSPRWELPLLACYCSPPHPAIPFSTGQVTSAHLERYSREGLVGFICQVRG